MNRRSRSFASLLLSIPFSFLSAIQAQTTDKQVIDRLLKRLADDEIRIQSLEARLGSGAAVVPVAAPVAPEAPDTGAMEALSASMDHSGHDAAMDMGPHLQMRGFGDFTFRASDRSGAANTFTLGQFDLFMTSKLSNHWNFIAENVIQADRETNSFGFEIERLMVTWHQSDYLNVAFGRYHQKIGYYNTVYHHGAYFQESVARPLLFEFEDGGGILPIHNVGVSAYGKLPSGRLGLHWVAEVGNGRTSHDPHAEYVQNVLDENNRKSVNLALFARPDDVEGLEIGGSVLKDRLYPDGSSKINQTISSAYVAYDHSGFQFLNEGVVVTNQLVNLNSTIHSSGFYTQVSRRMHGVSPFFRYEYLNVNGRDPIFGNIGRHSGPIGGIRFEVGEFSAFKVQYGHTWTTATGAFNYLTGQIAFAF